MRGRGRRIVVDADVGQAAADVRRAERGEAVDARALSIARSLAAMCAARHVAVFSPKLREEWKEHVGEGSSGRRWLARMRERKLVDTVSPEPDADWLEEIIDDQLPEQDRDVARKDAHLVATATSRADDRLLSGDRKAREKFARLRDQDRRIARLHWVDPSWEETPRWLLERTPDRPAWTLGATRDP